MISENTKSDPKALGAKSAQDNHPRFSELYLRKEFGFSEQQLIDYVDAYDRKKAEMLQFAQAQHAKLNHPHTPHSDKENLLDGAYGNAIYSDATEVADILINLDPHDLMKSLSAGIAADLSDFDLGLNWPSEKSPAVLTVTYERTKESTRAKAELSEEQQEARAAMSINNFCHS